MTVQGILPKIGHPESGTQRLREMMTEREKPSKGKVLLVRITETDYHDNTQWDRDR